MPFSRQQTEAQNWCKSPRRTATNLPNEAHGPDRMVTSVSHVTQGWGGIMKYSKTNKLKDKKPINSAIPLAEDSWAKRLLTPAPSL